MAQLYVVSFLAGTLSVLFGVSYNALFVSLVERDRYIEANSLIHGSRAFSFMGGPSLGGILVQAVSAPFAVLIDAFSFLGSALFLGSIHPEEPPVEEAGESRVSAGVRFIWRTPTLRASLLATATINFFNFVFAAIFILYATQTLGVTPATLGLVLGAGAAGGLIGAGIAGRLSRRIGVGPAYVLGCVLFPAPLVLVPLAGGPQWLVLSCLFLAEFGAGVGVVILDVEAGSIFQALVPDRLRSRFQGAYTAVNYGVRPLGSLLGGALGAAIGLRPTLWIASVGALAGVLFLLPSPIPRMRALPAAAE
jgi:predicted MFS family arabinose efflux permease